MNIGLIKKTSAAGKIFEILYGMIASGQFRPKEKLPSQDELAVRFGVSRNTLREAIHKLSAMGLLAPTQGVGTIVRPVPPDSYLSSLEGRLLLDPLSAREFIEARACVERTTVRLAVARSGPEDIKRLQAVLRAQRKAVARGDVRTFTQQDVAFHVELATLSGNRVLLKFLQTTWGMLHEFIAEVSQLQGAIEDAIRFHEEILDALVSRDAGKAEEWMLSHLLNVTTRIERNNRIDLDAESIFGRDLVSTDRGKTSERKSRRSKRA